MGKLEQYLLSDEYIMYLRKSRADNPQESVEEVLEKHEKTLQELALRSLGGYIPEHCIYREIVSGETISERPRMLEVLAQVENPRLKGVLVVESSRLSRGDLEDCGKVVNAFRYTRTEILTPKMTYDLTNEMHRKFFEQELMQGNSYLEYVKAVLLLGRENAVKQKGAYIGNVAPFGYDKAIIDGVHSLVPNDYADAVRLAFELYVNEGKTYLQIARHFDSIGIKPTVSEKWEKTSIRAMLRNKHYIGMVYFGKYRTEKTVENGQVVSRSVRQKESDMIIANGKHEAIVPLELFEAAQEKMDNNPRARWDAPITNPLAGTIFCHKCGKAMISHPYPHARTRIECRNRSGCNANSAALDDVIDAVIYALEMEQLPELEAKLNNNEGRSAVIQKKQLDKLNKELEELMLREETQFEMLENKTYTPEIFAKRNKALHVQMEELKTKIFEVKQSIPKEVDYEAKIIKLQDAIAALRDDSLSVEAKNKLVKAIVRRIDYDFIERAGKGKTRFALHVYLNI